MVIRQAVLSLLKEQTIDKITVADVCRLSEINRATFYRHYENQYGVLFEMEDDLLEQVPPVQDSEERLQTIFQTFEAKKGEWELLLSARLEESFSAKLYRAFLDWFPLRQPSPRRELRHSFLLHGLSGLLVHWAAGGFREPAQEIASHAIQLLHDLMGEGDPSLI